MNSMYSKETLKEVRKLFAIKTSNNGSQCIIAINNPDMPINNYVVLSTAADIEGEWLSDVKSIPLPHIIGYQYEPTKPQLYKHEKICGYYLNSYQKPSIAASVVDERPELFANFLERLFTNEEQRTYMERWMAFTVCQPEKRARVVPLLRGEQGTGKGVLCEKVLAPLVRLSNFYKADTLAELFGSHVSKTAFSTLVFLNELKGNKRDLANKLKPFISDDFKTINPKFEAERTEKVYFNTLAASNYDHPIYIEHDDRRWYVLDKVTHSTSKEETAAFYNEQFCPWLSKGGLSEILGWLQTLNVCESEFLVAPDTEAKMKLISEDPIARAEQELLDEIEAFNWVNIRHRSRLHKLDGRQIARLLSESGWINGNDKCRSVRGQGERVRVWFNPTTNPNGEAKYELTSERGVF